MKSNMNQSTEIFDDRNLTIRICINHMMTMMMFSGPEVLFKTCVAMKFVDDGDDDDVMKWLLMRFQEVA